MRSRSPHCAGSTAGRVLPPGQAWLKGFETLRVALTLGVVTTMAAFSANIASPLPPLRTFGFALAFGVFCAFISSTVLVGALHVFMERSSEAHAKTREWERLGRFSSAMVNFQRKQLDQWRYIFMSHTFNFLKFQ